MMKQKRDLIYKAYIVNKKMRDIACDGDRKDATARLLRTTITIEDAISMNQYIKSCVEVGIVHLHTN